MQERMIDWTPDLLRELVNCYQIAKDAGHKTFTMTIDGESCEFSVSYAKYLIEYLNGRLKNVLSLTLNRRTP